MKILETYNVNFIVLAGFLLMIPDFLINKFDHRIINIHPALLPKFGGKACMAIMYMKLLRLQEKQKRE